MQIAILAAGAWGTAMAQALAANHTVCLWSDDAECRREMQGERSNRRYLAGVRLRDALVVAPDLATAIDGAELIVCATPVAALAEVFAAVMNVAQTRLQTALPPFIWLCKGFERPSGRLPHQVVLDQLTSYPSPTCPVYGVLSGPSFAQEVAMAKPTALVLAANELSVAERLAAALSTESLRLYAGDDLVGVEVGGALKNVMAIATGICDGLDLGHNARAALITRGLAEMTRLAVAMGAKTETMMGLAGIGDLLLTCTGDLSRNRQVGLALAAGESLPQILQNLGHVAEGVGTAQSVAMLSARYAVDMPIATAVSDLLAAQITAREALQRLLARQPRREV